MLGCMQMQMLDICSIHEEKTTAHASKLMVFRLPTCCWRHSSFVLINGSALLGACCKLPSTGSRGAAGKGVGSTGTSA